MKSIGFILLTLATFAWRVQGLTWQSLWRDEVDAVRFATRYLPETLAMFVQREQNGPLYFVALRPWFNLIGTSEFALRFPSAAAGVLGVLLTWQVTRGLLPLLPFGSVHTPASVSAPTSGRAVELTAWLAALFMAVNPYQLWYGQEGKMYTIVTTLVLLATWWWLAGITRGGWRPWLAYLVTVSLAMYTHLLLILLFPVHFIWFWLAWPQSRHHWRGYALALTGLTLPYLPMLWWQWDLLTVDVVRTGFTFTSPLEMARTILLNHSRGFMPPTELMGDLMWLLPIFFLGAAGVVLGAGELAASNHLRDNFEFTPSEAATDEPDAPDKADESEVTLHLSAWRRWALVISWILVPAVSIYALSLRQPIFTDRYIIWIAPALMMLMALGVVVVRRYAFFLGRLLAAGLLVYVVSFWLYAGWQQKTQPTKYDLRAGVTYLAQHRSSNDLLILQIPYMEWPYRYYTSDFGARPFDESEARLLPWIGGLWTNQGWPDDVARLDVAQQLAEKTAGFTDVWVLRSEVEMWDQRHLMDEWLDEHGELIDQADFHGVQVRHYRLRSPL